MTIYKKGMQFTCPECGEDSIVTSKTEMDGWTKIGEYLACSLCGTKLESTNEQAGSDSPAKRSEGAKNLMDFLGTGTVDKETVIEDDGSRRFCRDCSHLLEHPFKIYCLFHKKDVNPMDDCDKFERKSS